MNTQKMEDSHTDCTSRIEPKCSTECHLLKIKGRAWERNREKLFKWRLGDAFVGKPWKVTGE